MSKDRNMTEILDGIFTKGKTKSKPVEVLEWGPEIDVNSWVLYLDDEYGPDLQEAEERRIEALEKDREEKEKKKKKDEDEDKPDDE